MDVEGLRRRDEDAWRTLHDAEFPLLYRAARGLGADPETAEDCAHEAFERLLGAIDRLSLDGPEALRGWLFVVCRNRVRDEQRRRRHEPLDTQPERADADAEVGADARSALRVALAALPDGQRDVIVLRFLVGLPTREVCVANGRGAKAVESLQQRGLAALRRSAALQGYQP